MSRGFLLFLRGLIFTLLCFSLMAVGYFGMGLIDWIISL